jgi:hypothetical protein
MNKASSSQMITTAQRKPSKLSPKRQGAPVIATMWLVSFLGTIIFISSYLAGLVSFLHLIGNYA